MKKAKRKEDQPVELCQKCKKNPATPDHPCPYREELDDDSKTLCNCCDSCRQECSDDV